MSSENKSIRGECLLELAIILALAVISIFAWLLNRSVSEEMNLRAIQRDISQEIVAGMDARAAKKILIEKYDASLIEDKLGSDIVSLSFSIIRKADKRGVSQALVVVVNIDNQKVRSVEAELGGMGP